MKKNGRKIKCKTAWRLSILCSLLLFILLSFTACQGRETEAYLEELKKFEEDVYDGQKLSDTRIKELKASIEKFKEKVEAKVKATENLRSYYKMLGVAYLNRQMYGPAADALKDSLYYSPDNAILYYYMGVCKARLSKTAPGGSQDSKAYLEEAKYNYNRAIELKPGYEDALYGLSVIYVFETKEYNKALETLTKLLREEKTHTEGRFLLARVYAETGRYEKAIDAYNYIIENSGNKEERQAAERNKQQILNEGYGQ